MAVEMETESINMVQYIHIAEKIFQAIRESLIKVIQEVWPMNKKDLPSDIAHYHSFQEELNAQSGVVFRGERVVIPDALRRWMIR